MMSPVLVSLLIKLGHYSAYFLELPMEPSSGYLKPWAEEEKRRVAEEKKKQDEQKWIERELAVAQDDSILK
ncbi:ATP synthase subunit e, mitochondrial-like [Lutra lutra]|uniref:ATP synthase subunit e, mitochondrial-like n=1 Tax=Lutra lutra TaxID=9657 RepID=UPI001FD1C219|nr:ATP synthase subunit e, mitochondrial-like [Lutra lutra]